MSLSSLVTLATSTTKSLSSKLCWIDQKCQNLPYTSGPSRYVCVQAIQGFLVYPPPLYPPNLLIRHNCPVPMYCTSTMNIQLTRQTHSSTVFFSNELQWINEDLLCTRICMCVYTHVYVYMHAHILKLCTCMYCQATVMHMYIHVVYNTYLHMCDIISC